MLKRLLIIPLVLTCFDLFPQDDKLSDIITSVAEGLADDEADPEGVSIFTERLYELYENPVKLNTADESEISRLFFLTDFQIKSVTDYLKRTGRIFTKYELSSINGFDQSLAELISPFISLEPDDPGNNRPNHLRGNLISNFSSKINNTDSSWLGSPLKTMQKLNLTAGNCSGGLTIEKDAGEKLLAGRPAMPDFFSSYLSWSGKGIIRKIILGDFSAGFGMGSALSSGMRTGLSLTQTGYISGSNDIKPYTSTYENGFFRGVAGTISYKGISLSAFWSLNRTDASTGMTSDSSGLYIRTFTSSGIHNTISLNESKDAVTDRTFGVNLYTDLRNIRLGVLLSSTSYSLPVKPDFSSPEEVFDFDGSNNHITSVYYKSGFGKLILFGEVSADKNFRKAIIQGLAFRPDDRLTLNLLYRCYDPGFTAFHGRGILAPSSGDNIKGIFGNFTLEAAKHLFISAGCDLRYSPWLHYRCSSPSVAVSCELRARYLPLTALSIEGQYSFRQNEYDMQEETGVNKQHTLTTKSCKLSVRYSPASNFSLSTRLDYKIGGYEISAMGMLLSQDISYSLIKTPLKIWIRYCLFRTDNWDTRLYVYEHDLLNSFSIPALSGTGSRNYIMLGWKPGKHCELRFKYGILTRMTESGMEDSEEIKLQAKLLF